MTDDLVGRDVAALGAYDAEQWSFVPQRVRNADRGRLGDPGEPDSGVFEGDGADPLAAGLDHIPRTGGDLHRAIWMQAGDVARVEPLLIVRRVLIGLEV